MFENLSHLALQQYWWFIVSLLGAIFVALMFVQGGQTLLPQIGRNTMHRTMLVNTLGRKWELTFTTLVTFGGAFFASFPLFYSTSFGGAYWVWMIILFGFIIQAVSYEYRKKAGNFLGTKTFDTFLLINGFIATVFIGTAVGTFFTGSMFSINEFNFSKWEHPAHGLEAVLNFQNVALGLAVFFLSRILGALYFMQTIDNIDIFSKSKKQVLLNTIPFLIFFLAFVVLLLLSDGFAVNIDTKEVTKEPYKYWQNFMQMPIVLILFLSGVVLVLFSLIKSIFFKLKNAFYYAAGGTIMVVLSLFLISGYNNTAFYPSIFELNNSLTIQNASSSHYTLTAMSYVSLFVPVVIAYIVIAWRKINSKKITEEEINESTKQGEHVY